MAPLGEGGDALPGLIGPDEEAKSRESQLAHAGTFRWFAAGGAVGSVALLDHIHGWVAWPLASFAATAIYLVAGSVQLAVIAIRLAGDPTSVSHSRRARRDR